TSRVLLHRKIADAFLDMLTTRADGMAVGDGSSETTDMGPVAGPQQYKDVTAAIRQAVSDGARVAAGAKAGELPQDGYFVRPTVLTGVTQQMPAFRDEIFGPVLAICEFISLED